MLDFEPLDEELGATTCADGEGGGWAREAGGGEGVVPC